MLGAGLLFLTPCLLGWLLTRRLEGPQTLRLGLALLLGTGLTSLLAWARLGAVSPGVWRGVELSLVLLAGGVAWRWRLPPSAPSEQAESSLQERRLGRLLLLAIPAALVTSLARRARFPRGEWDAWAIWNLHARALHRAPERWAEVLAPLAWSHPDYPLGLPLLVERGWSLVGVASPWVPYAINLCFLLALGLVLHGALLALRGRACARLGTLLLLATPFVLFHSASQYADLPLAAFVLGAFACLRLHATRPRPALLVCAGLCAGFAAWTKNEGAIWAGLFLLACPLEAWRCGRNPGRKFACFALGLAPGAAALLALRVLYPASNDLVAGLNAEALSARLVDPQRYGAIALAFLRQGIHPAWGPLTPLLLAGLVAWRRRALAPSARRAGLLLGTLVMTYAGIYLVTPRELEWHLSVSLQRLLLHAWPATILWALSATKSFQAKTLARISHHSLREAEKNAR